MIHLAPQAIAAYLCLLAALLTWQCSRSSLGRGQRFLCLDFRGVWLRLP